ncbi:hypothetical protein L593_06355 [Salinarchaeum sp. Harcht-Bsk1]|uniref:BREX-5 system adenine-specific DNA-methyltransferase PglX n=1 Tax=Salinarchaeum sp. Harcht-Bsk1 TaxID=1333523 RepID=UPI0003424290|nr:BREX-5 system adenine-specific DNA-methyltransferase PglX [Salinarchaeum sp. Harcht-Bsk1]AGN01218.1 hypothetical protein L593_06355 [Salinarchaeum sp. Harcht-Bsk1]
MASDSLSHHKAQLDKEEREHLEDVVADMRERVEDNVRFQLTQHGLGDEPEDRSALDEEAEQLVEAIELEAVDGNTWGEAFEQYVTGVGYTIVNRLAALRCMEVRDFVDEEVTVFKDNGLTPAAETLVTEEFLLEEEAILQAYHDACDDLAAEIEILFDRSSAYSQVDPDDDTFDDLCGMLDSVPDEVWRADDVLGWVYEYYNRPVVEALDAKNTLAPEDVGPANQFYTPHWVVRMLTDNSLGKLYLEATDQTDAIPEPEALSPEERKDRLVTPADAPSVTDLCTYLIPDEEPGEAPEFDHPRELRVIDPACGSGHFLLYAFDVLERIWWAETDLDRAAIPEKVLEHNLYGVDIDLRSCQLSAFNLYLKARTRAEAQDGQFEMPNVGIVCADARVAEVDEATDVLDDITGEGSDLREELDDVTETFQHTEALGSLLDVGGTLEEAFDSSKMQAELSDYNGGAHQSLHSFLKALRRAVADQTNDSFREQNLRSFLHLLAVLTQDYDVALMNPPYGSGGRMPSSVQAYVEEHYEYMTEYYANFFEACDRLARDGGRVGMLVPRSFLFNQTLEPFRADFIGNRGSFDFLAEFGYGILDNATVGTAGTVVRSGSSQDTVGSFIRLHDVEKGDKEATYLRTAFTSREDDEIVRHFEIAIDEFNEIPGRTLCYSLPEKIRDLHSSDRKIGVEDDTGGVERIADVKQGLATGDNSRFLRAHWETSSSDFQPFTNAGGKVWVLPEVDEVIDWTDSGSRIRRYSGSRFQNTQYYHREGLTWAYIKRTGRRFGYYPDGGLFGHASNMIFPISDISLWSLLGVLNSDAYHGLMLCLTPERKWEAGYVGKLPWFKKLEGRADLAEKVKEQYRTMIKQSVHNFGSPYYIGPVLLPESRRPTFFYTEHDHQRAIAAEPDTLFETGQTDETLLERSRQAVVLDRRRQKRIETLADEIDQEIFQALGVDSATRNQVKEEIWLRTVEEKSDREVPSPDEVPEYPEIFPKQIKDLILHLALCAVRRADDGIIPVSDVEGEDDLLTHITAEFERVWGDHADARLAEVDDVLGRKSAGEAAYPNLRTWLEEDLFDYHVSKFDRVPILWRFTTERLVSDSEGEGFGCLVDYHQLDGGAFDGLQNRYLEPRKNRLRERRSAANRRRSDDSLSASKQAEAAEEYARCESGLEQISVLEDRLAELAQPEPRQWSTEEQAAADAAAKRVAEFRRRTEKRLEIVDELAAMDDVDVGELFTGNFYEKIENQREEWIDALGDLEAAFDAYAADSEQPVGAHLYDLFDYYTDDLLGSSHFASNGILYMTYYFDEFEQADQGRLGDAGVARRQRLISQLARDLDEYIDLGEAIAEDCEELSSEISSDWEDRALSEITAAGYQPNHKHGVEINITPLAEAEIVPETVEEQVL